MLTDTAAKQTKPTERPYQLSDGKGLYLEVKRAEKLRKKTLAAESFGAIAQEGFEKEKPHWSQSHRKRARGIIGRDLAAPTSAIAEIAASELLSRRGTREAHQNASRSSYRT